MQPHLVRWQQQYGSQGLAIVYVDDARRDALENARSVAAQVPFGFYYDRDGGWNRACGVQAYPTGYIVTRASGYEVVWEGIPVFNPQATEQAIVAVLGR